MSAELDRPAFPLTAQKSKLAATKRLSPFSASIYKPSEISPSRNLLWAGNLVGIHHVNPNRSGIRDSKPLADWILTPATKNSGSKDSDSKFICGRHNSEHQ